MRCVMPLLALVSLAFAPAPFSWKKADQGKEDLKKMQGAWTVIRRSVAGNVMSSEDLQMTVVIAGDRIRFLVKGEVRTEWAIALDATKTPKVLDRTLMPGKAPALESAIAKLSRQAANP